MQVSRKAEERLWKILKPRCRGRFRLGPEEQYLEIVREKEIQGGSLRKCSQRLEENPEEGISGRRVACLESC